MFESILKSAAAKRIAGAVAVLGLFTAGAASATANGPVLNGVSNDYPTLQVAKGGQAYGTSVTATAGETLNLLIWDHNAVPDTTARAVKIKAVIPSTASAAHQVSATVSADNAASATGAVSIATGAETRLSYVPGSARFLRNVGGAMAYVDFPAGVNGDQVVSTGINLGDQNGCWSYAQAVLIQVKVEGTVTGINANKKVELAGGSTGFSDSATANPGDALNYEIFVQNTGNGTGTNGKIVDVLDERTSYIPNSSYALNKRNNQDYKQAIADSNIKFEGNRLTWAVEPMAPRPDTAIYLIFQARVQDAGRFQVGTVHIPNCADVAFDGAALRTNCTDVTVVKRAEPVVSFSLRKEITNRTLGDSLWYDQRLASAKPGDAVSFRLTLVNTGNVDAQNVVLKDLLPAGIVGAANAKLYDGQHPQGMVIDANALVRGGYTVATLNPGTPGTKTVVFDADLTGSCTGTTTLTNLAQVVYLGKVAAQDDASALISCTRGLLIQKQVLNPATGGYVDSLDNVREGQVLTYRITVINNGTVTAVRPVLRDQLPEFLKYVRTSLAIDGEFMTNDIQDAFLSGGMTLTDLTPGLGKTVTFQAKVSDCPPFGDTAIVNVSSVYAQQVAEISGTATAYVRVNRPDLRY